jgi:hypothetical protein
MEEESGGSGDQQQMITRSPSNPDMTSQLSTEAKERSQRISLFQAIGQWSAVQSTRNLTNTTAIAPTPTPNQNIAVQRGTIARVMSRFSSANPSRPHTTGGRHSLLKMFSTKNVPKSAPVSSTMGKRMLTCGQLSDLFRRLDRDGNGELDLEEFTQIINKLKINASEDFVARSAALLSPLSPPPPLPGPYPLPLTESSAKLTSQKVEL